MPVTVRHDPDEIARLRKLRDGALTFQQRLAELRRRGIDYVVLHGDEIVGESDSPEGAWAEAERRGAPRDECLVLYVPAEGETIHL